MTGYTATIPAYVRTAAGIVKVGAGERIPGDALPSDLDRLTSAGVLIADPEPAPTEPEPDADAGATVTGEKPKRTRKAADHKPAASAPAAVPEES